MKKRILVVTYGGGHANIIKLLYPELSKKFSVTILALTTAEEVFRAANIPYKSLEDYLDIIAEEVDILKLGEDFIRSHNIEFDRLGIEKSSIYYGCNLQDYVKQFGMEDVEASYTQYGRAMFLPLNTMKKIIEYERPAGVLTTNSPRFERAAILISKELKIINFSIEDLFGGERIFSQKDKATNYLADYLLVNHECVKRKLLKKNLQVKEIIVTGQPIFQGIANYKMDKFAFREKYNVPVDKQIICWATQPLEEEGLILRELLHAFSKSNNKVLIIKPHPNENSHFISEQLRAYKEDNVRLITDANIKEIISVSEVLLTQYSTCGLEAISMNKPVIVLNPLNKKYVLDYSELNLGIAVHNIANIEEAIDCFIQQTGEEALVVLDNIMNFSIPENPIRSIIEVIENKLSEN